MEEDEAADVASSHGSDLGPIPESDQSGSSSSSDEDSNMVLHVAFNGSCRYFAIGYDEGVMVYRAFDSGPVEALSPDVGGAEICIVEMDTMAAIPPYIRLALVGSGVGNSEFSRNRVMIWGQKEGRIVERKVFSEEIVGVRLRTSRIVVVLKTSVIVCSIPGLIESHSFPSSNNDKGLCEISQGSSNLLVYPPIPGKYLSIVRLNQSRPVVNLRIDGEYDIACIALSLDGTMLAVASVIVVSMFNTQSGNLLQEVRYQEYWDMWRVAISPENALLAVLNERGCIYVFRLMPDPEVFEDDDGNPRIYTEISSEASKFEPGKLVKEFHFEECYEYVIGFGDDDTVIALDVHKSFRVCREDRAYSQYQYLCAPPQPEGPES